VRNRSEQSEARLAMVEILDSPSIFFKGMTGSRIPIVTAHGEGRAQFGNIEPRLVCMRYVNNRGEPTEVYPYNPAGTPQGITGLTTADGRFTILMPHPERVSRTILHSWHPDDWPEEGPWMRLFRNARVWIG
jgi:phosphoribosylformylglycinamidine synthase